MRDNIQRGRLAPAEMEKLVQEHKDRRKLARDLVKNLKGTYGSQEIYHRIQNSDSVNCISTIWSE